MSLKLTTSLSQRLVLTPQLRQRIEMLQMTTLELTDLIQQQLLENPVLEEVATQEEAQELAEKILDHLTSADPGSAPEVHLEATEPEPGSPGSNGSADLDAAAAYSEVDHDGNEVAGSADLSEDSMYTIPIAADYGKHKLAIAIAIIDFNFLTRKRIIP